MNCPFCNHLMIPSINNYHTGWICHHCPHPVAIADFSGDIVITYQNPKTLISYQVRKYNGKTIIYRIRESRNHYDMLNFNFEEIGKSENQDITPTNVEQKLKLYLTFS